jgi:hypothetical protein
MGRFNIGGGEPLQTVTEKVRRRWQTFESLSAPDRQIRGVECNHGKWEVSQKGSSQTTTNAIGTA